MDRFALAIIYLAQGAIAGMITMIVTHSLAASVLVTILAAFAIWRFVSRSEAQRRARAGGPSQFVDQGEAERRAERRGELERHGIIVGDDGLFHPKP